VLLAAVFFALLPALVLGLVDWLDADMPRRIVYAAVLLLVLAGLVAGNVLLRDRPDWEAEIAALNASRAPLQPIVTALDARTAPGYYDRQDVTAIRRGLGLQVGWHDQNADDLRPALAALDAAPSVWVFMPEGDAQTQTVLDILGESRRSGYREIVGDMLITRMDRPPGSDQ
jgi:hypothetical protein